SEDKSQNGSESPHEKTPCTLGGIQFRLSLWSPRNGNARTTGRNGIRCVAPARGLQAGRTLAGEAEIISSKYLLIAQPVPTGRVRRLPLVPGLRQFAEFLALIAVGAGTSDEERCAPLPIGRVFLASPSRG